jgi:hypothetical protein
MLYDIGWTHTSLKLKAIPDSGGSELRAYAVPGARRHSKALAAAVLVICLLMALPAQSMVVSGTSSAEGYGEPGYEGYWRYCLDVTWDTAEVGGYAMSFVNFLISLGDCPCACSPDLVIFDDVAGTGTGQHGCELSFYGIYDCHEDPHFPELGPSIKFEYADTGCEPAPAGSATVCFYSVFGPGEQELHTDVLGIKASTSTVRGDLLGVLPVCVCGSPVEDASWGVVKALYR